MYFVQLFINFEYTKAVTYTVENDGGDTGQDPATEVTHLRLNQPPIFFFSDASFLRTTMKLFVHECGQPSSWMCITLAYQNSHAQNNESYSVQMIK